MRYAVVVSSPRNYASLFVVRAAAASDSARLVAVLYCTGRTAPKGKVDWIKRRLRKLRRIGLLGALNGIRMRRWYGTMLADRLGCPPLHEACDRSHVPLINIASFADEAAHHKLRDLEVDVAVSLGNGIIPPDFFSIPRLGMLNVHHEHLPEYRGAQTVLWQLHDGSNSSGYSVHEITERLDAGCILLRERVPFQWGRTLRDTVINTTAEVQLRSIEGLLRVLRDYAQYRQRAMTNESRNTYTTPNARAMLRIYRNFLRLRRQAIGGLA